jgi:hypothetical protein
MRVNLSKAQIAALTEVALEQIDSDVDLLAFVAREPRCDPYEKERAREARPRMRALQAALNAMERAEA